jgi:hypothetical protein
MSKIDITAIENFGFENDPIVIRQQGRGIIGGRLLDLDNYSPEYVRVGQVIIRDEENEVSKPWPVKVATDGTLSYDALPVGYKVEGVSLRTILVSDPEMVGVMYEGEVNDVASPIPLADIVLTAIKASCPNLTFKHD